MDNFKRRKRIGNIGLTLGIAIFLLFIFGTNLLHFNYKMNADIASEVVLAELIWKSGQIVPESWYVSSEARIISTPNLASLFYGLTDNMTLAFGLGCCFMTIFIVVSILFFCRKAGLNKTETALFAFLGLAFFTNINILELLYLFAGYYAIHVIALFFTLGLYAQSIKNKRISWLGTAISLVWALCLGMQGMRGILVLYGPLFGTEVVRNIYHIYCKRSNYKSDWIISVWTCALLAISFIGTRFPFSVGQNISRNIRKGIYKLFSAVIPDMYSAAGFKYTNILGKICLVIFLLITLFLLIDVVLRMFRKREVEVVEWSFLVMCFSIIVPAIMVAFTTVESTERYYFLLFYAMAFAVVLMWRKIGNRWKALVGILITIFSLINIQNIYLPILKQEEPPETELYAVGEYLADNNYLRAYSTFDNANTITVLMNGKIRVSSVASVDKMDVCKWLSSKSWYVPNVPFKERTAYIIPEVMMDEFERFLEEHGKEVKFDTKIGSYLIYISDYNFSQLGE